MIERGETVPDFQLEAVAGDSNTLTGLLSDGPALIVFVERDCPTSRLTLERLQPLDQTLRSAGIRLAAVHQLSLIHI